MTEQPYRQNVKTELLCPRCAGTLLIMTRKADGKRFLGCARYYDPTVKCDYTENRVPEHLLMREAGAPTLPGLD